MSRGLRQAAAGLGSLVLVSAAHADPLKLVPGTPVTLVCATNSVVVIPEAASTRGEVRLQLEAAQAGSEAGAKGTWSVAGWAANHTASFAAIDHQRCKTGCDLTAAEGRKIELWSPKRASPAALPPDEPLTVVAIDPITLKLTATTVIAKVIAAFEKGECSVVP